MSGTPVLAVGYTLSQCALAARLLRSTSWIRSQGELVTQCGETWVRMEYSGGRCAGYKLVSTPPIKRTVLSFPGDPDIELKP